MRLSPLERLLLTLALLCSLVSGWQFVLFHADNCFADGLCAALGTRNLAPEARALQLFRWVSTYDEAVLPSVAVAPCGPVTPRSMVEHAAYFRANCGKKAWLLAVLCRRCGLPAHELRLCDTTHTTRHVVCEVRVHGRWVVFDPTFHLAFRRSDGQLATAVELRDPHLLDANAARAPGSDHHRWRFDHPERLHFEKLPLLGGLLRRLAPHLTGRPANELAMPAVLERPRLVMAGGFALLGLFPLVWACRLARRRVRLALRREKSRPAPVQGLTLEAESE